MIEAAALLALFLHRPLPLVETVYQAGGADAVALVECESNFNPKAIRREPRGHTSYGLYQLDDEYHPQYRGDLLRHIAEGQLFLDECKAKTKSFPWAVARYNGSIVWGLFVEAERNRLVRWLDWREMKAREVASR